MKLHKILGFLTICAASAMISAPSVLADETPISVLVDNTAIEFADQAPVIDNGRTLVPIRAVFEKAGANVTWNQSTQTATLKKDQYTVTIKLGEAFITKNNQPIAIDVPSQIINDRILIPVRAISEAMDFGVTWNPVFRSVLISTDGNEYRPHCDWKTGFKPLKEHGFYVEASVADLNFDLNNDEAVETITFTKADETTSAALSINGTNYTEHILEACSAPFAIGVVDINKNDKYTEIMLVDSGSATVTAHFFRYNGFDLFELKTSREGLNGIEFSETLFFDGTENIISDLDGLAFLDVMVCPGIYSLEEDSVNRYYLDCAKVIGTTLSPKYNDNMAFSVHYTDTYEKGAFIGNAELTPETILANDLPKSIKITDLYIDMQNPANFEFFIEFPDGKKAVIWPYSV